MDGPSSYPICPVPASSVVRAMFPDHGASTDSVASYQIVPRNKPHASAVVVLLLSGSLSQMEEVHRRRRLSRPFCFLEFVLSSIGRTWAALSTTIFYTQPASGYCIGALIRCLRNLLGLLIPAATTSINVSRASLLLYQIMSVILVENPPTPDSRLESEVCQALLDVSSMAQQSTSILHSHKEILLPKLLEVVNAPDHFVSLSNELQVGACYLVGLCFAESSPSTPLCQRFATGKLTIR